MTRCPQGGTQTVLTRRPGRAGRGYAHAPGALGAALRRPCRAAPADAVRGRS